MSRLIGKVALVTGAARGQGRSHAVRLAEEGADVIGVDICAAVRNVTYPAATAEDLAETARAVRATGREMLTARVDVRDASALTASVDEAAEGLGGLDIVVANAAVCIPGAWDLLSAECWQDTLDINLTGAWNTVRAGVPHLTRRDGGSVILVSSGAALRPRPWLSAYVASKFAVTGLAKALAIELGEHNIRVNSLHPGGIDTPMATTGVSREFGKRHPRLAGAFPTALPVGLLEADRVSDAVVFLAGDESRYITGHALPVDAGSTQY